MARRVGLRSLRSSKESSEIDRVAVQTLPFIGHTIRLSTKEIYMLQEKWGKIAAAEHYMKRRREERNKSTWMVRDSWEIKVERCASVRTFGCVWSFIRGTQKGEKYILSGTISETGFKIRYDGKDYGGDLQYHVYITTGVT